MNCHRLGFHQGGNVYHKGFFIVVKRRGCKLPFVNELNPLGGW